MASYSFPATSVTSTEAHSTQQERPATITCSWWMPMGKFRYLIGIKSSHCTQARRLYLYCLHVRSRLLYLKYTAGWSAPFLSSTSTSTRLRPEPSSRAVSWTHLDKDTLETTLKKTKVEFQRAFASIKRYEKNPLFPFSSVTYDYESDSNNRFSFQKRRLTQTLLVMLSAQHSE